MYIFNNIIVQMQPFKYLADINTKAIVKELLIRYASKMCAKLQM